MEFVCARICVRAYFSPCLRKSYLRKAENALKSYLTGIVYLSSYNTKANRYHQDTGRRYSYDVAPARYTASLQQSQAAQS